VRASTDRSLVYEQLARIGKCVSSPHRIEILDLLAQGEKSVEAIAPVHKKQLLTHLRLANKRLGLRINFGEELIKDGIHRVVNGLAE
jgi:GxxExxY protein